MTRGGEVLVSLARRKVVVVTLGALLAGAVLFAGSSATGVVNDAHAAKSIGAGGAKAE